MFSALLRLLRTPHSYATFLNATFHSNEVSSTHPSAICLFERDEGTPMQRHSSSSYVAATKNIAFTLRSVSTVGNYDYSFDYTFFMDGSIETVVRASGCEFARRRSRPPSSSD